MRALFGEYADWSVTDSILANVYDVLAHANWQRAADKHAARPRPFPRPMSPEERAREQLRKAELRRRLEEQAQRLNIRRITTEGQVTGG